MINGIYIQKHSFQILTIKDWGEKSQTPRIIHSASVLYVYSVLVTIRSVWESWIQLEKYTSFQNDNAKSQSVKMIRIDIKRWKVCGVYLFCFRLKKSIESIHIFPLQHSDNFSKYFLIWFPLTEPYWCFRSFPFFLYVSTCEFEFLYVLSFIYLALAEYMP